MKKTLIAAALCGIFASGNAFVLDDFTTGPYSVTITSGSVIASQAGTMVGLQRDVLLTVISSAFGQPVQQNIGGGMSITNSGTMTDARVGLQYDGSDVENPTGTVFNHGPGFAPMDWSTLPTLRINFLANDRTLDLQARIEGSGESIANLVVAGGHDTPFAVDIPIASFAGTADLTHITHASFYFDTSPSGDFGIGSIEVVPEPGTLLVAAAGALLLLNRKRR